MTDRSTNVLWLFFICILLTGLAFSRAQDKKVQFYESAQFGGWVAIEHESDTYYFLKTDAIIGFVDPLPGDPKKRAGILLQSGGHLTTNIDIEAFRKLVKESDE